MTTLSNKPLLLDLFCGAGGCSVGYYRAGFRVEGVDLYRQPHYPFRFFLEDAISFLSREGGRYDAIHASPPCQGYSQSRYLQRNDHPLLIEPIRDLLLSFGKPYIIENVVGSPLRNPVLLTGPMFSLGVLRERLFECSFPVIRPIVPISSPVVRMGRKPAKGQLHSPVGNFAGTKRARAAMGITWMTRNEMAQAIPPAYTQHIGNCLLQFLNKV